jgi:hypothetical protein
VSRGIDPSAFGSWRRHPDSLLVLLECKFLINCCEQSIVVEEIWMVRERTRYENRRFSGISNTGPHEHSPFG